MRVISKRQWRLFAVAAAVMLFIGSGSRGGEKRWLVSEELLKSGGLEIVWQKDLPMKQKEKVEWVVLTGDRLFAVTSENFMVSINRNTGREVFSKMADKRRPAIVGLETYKETLFSVIGNELVEMDMQSGEQLGAKELKGGLNCPAARNGAFYYVADLGTRMRVLRADDKVPLFEVAADDDSRITSMLASESFAIFATNSGYVISMAPGESRQLWRFKASDSIVGQIVHDSESLFVSSRDTNVYKLDLQKGGLEWKYPAGGLLDVGPQVTEKAVYQYVPTKGITAVDKVSGQLKWELGEGKEFLAEGKAKTYVITADSKLAVVDNDSNKKVCSINFAGVNRCVANTVDSKIYVGNERGRIICLKPKGE